jgi:hypothetical protein
MRDLGFGEQSPESKPRTGKTYGLPTFARFVESFFARRVDRKIERTPQGNLGGFLVLSQKI